MLYGDFFMENKINIKINDFGPINKADIDLNKINVVGGNNATGKSTTSKLLYCFLKSKIICFCLH